MTASGDEEEEMDLKPPSCLPPPADIAMPLTTTQHCDDQPVHSATSANMADSLCSSEPNMDAKIHVTLVNDSVWQEFHSIGTEMLLTRQGRRMFPFCRYRISGMNPNLLYFLIMDFHLMDEYRYRWTVGGRVLVGPSEVQESRSRVYTHPSSPRQGAVWMDSPVVFGAVKLTSDLLNDDGLVVLHSNHRYIPRLHIVPFDPNGKNTVSLDNPDAQTFIFPQTEFYAVSCYQNPSLIKLKIKHNPFARQFLDEEVLKPSKNIQITPHKSSVSASSDSKNTKKWAKKRSSLPAAAELGFGASPVLKKRMNSSGLSLRDDFFSLAGGLTCTEEMISTDNDSGSSSDSGEQPVNTKFATPCLKKQVPANLKLKKASTATKASARPFTSTPRIMKRPVQITPKTPKMPLHKSSAGKTAKGSSVVMETPSEPDEGTPELSVDDVEGMLFVSFPSKASHDTHVPLKRQLPPLPPPPPPSPPPPQLKCPPALQVQEATRATEPEEVPGEGPEVLQDSIVQLEKVLLLDLGSVKHRQVVHPALQHVGLKLNLVDPEVAIDLQYLGVTLPLPPFPQSSADGSIPFVSRTGKTNDLTKIKGWRDKYSSSSDLPLAPPQERVVKVSSAFSSDLLDEYLESEAQSITERAETFSSSGSTDAASAAGTTGGTGVTYRLPSRGSSYVRTLDSVLKRQATSTSTDGPSLSSANTPHGSPSLTGIGPKGAAHSQTWSPGTSRIKLSLTTQPVPLYPHKHTPRPGIMSPVVPQVRITAPLAPRLPSGKMQLKRNNLAVSSYGGVTTPHRRLQAMERQAFCRGHANTYITTERATIALGVLLTAEGSLKADRVKWTSEDLLGPCQKDFCRLGCVCLSLEREPRGPTHCQRAQCMFECSCFRHRVLLVRPHPDSSTNSRTQKVRKEHAVETTDMKILAYPISEANKGSRPAPGQHVRVLWQGRTNDKDPEPMFMPEMKCMYEFRASLLVTSKAPTKSQPKVCGRRTEEVQKDSPVYMYFDSMMTCARVRPINSMPPPQVHILPARVSNKAKGNTKQSPETPVSKLNSAAPQTSVPLAQNPEEIEAAQTTRMLEIVSECNWEPHRELVLGALQRRLKLNLLVPSFALGYYQVCLLSTTQQKSQNHTTITYKLSISRNESDGNSSASGASEKEKPPKKAQPPQPSQPGYLKACKLGCGVSPRRLIEVNGKQYAKAKLMLGQMGALQPASRLAAFVTGRLITLPKMEAGVRLKAPLNKTSKAMKSAAPEAIKTSKPLSSTKPSSPTPEASAVKSAVPGSLAASQLLYIPIGSPDCPTPSVPIGLDPATQKVMLKPVANTQNGALYCQPNGQLVQLVPLKPLKAIMPKPAPGSALGAESDLPTPSSPWPENDASPSSACQDGDTDTPDSSTSVVKPFSLSGKSTMCISQGSTAVRSLPGIGIFSFRICPPTEMAKVLGPDSQVHKDNQNPSQTSPSLALPGGFTLIQLPQVSNGEMKTSGISAETKVTAALLQTSDQSQGTLCKQGSQTAETSTVGAPIDRTLVKEKKIIAPVVVPPMSSVFRPPQLKRTSLGTSRQGSGASLASNVSHRTSQQGSGASLASNASHRTSQQGSGASLASDASHKTSQQGSGTPKANATDTNRKAARVWHRIQGPKTVSSLSSILTATSTKEKHQRTILDMAFRKLKEVLHMSNLKVTQQDILDQARLIICALQRREKSLEEKKSAMSDIQSDYIKTISQLSGKPEEMIRKKLKETSKRQRLLEQYRQRKPEQVQLAPKECDWLTERFAIWKRHVRKSRRKVLDLSPPLPTGEELAMGTPQSSRHSGGKARDSPELRAALLTPGNNATQGSSSGQRQSNPSLGLDVNKVLALLKMKSLPPLDNQSGEPIKLLCAPDLKNVDKPSENIDKVAKGRCLDVKGSDDRSESVVEDAGNISPSGPVNASSSQQENDSQHREVSIEGAEKALKLEQEVKVQSRSDAALDTDTAEQQCVDEKASADQTSENIPEKSRKNTKKRNASPPPVVNTAPKRKRGRPPKHAKQAAAAQPKPKTAPPVSQKVKHSTRLQARQLRSHSPVSTRTHPRRGKRRGRR